MARALTVRSTSDAGDSHVAGKSGSAFEMGGWGVEVNARQASGEVTGEEVRSLG